MSEEKNRLLRLMEDSETPDDLQAAMRDVLTDLRHLADEKKLDFYQALAGSYDVYLEELQQ